MSYFCVVKIHEKYLSRCIQLAKNGLGSTYPNPLVGSVIVHNGKIIGEGDRRDSGARGVPGNDLYLPEHTSYRRQ